MQSIALYCKSYHNDFHRVVRLATSITTYNKDQLPFYVSVPRSDLKLFEPIAKDHNFSLLADETILELTLATGRTRTIQLEPRELQQVVKSEFWRLRLAKNYLVIDSDSYFIKPFFHDDFIYQEDQPYTVINEGSHMLHRAARAGMSKRIRQYRELRERAKTLFNRPGRLYDFAPTPCIWSSTVWAGLARDYADPRGLNFQDLIMEFPCETQWYGEYLLTHPVIPLRPIEPLFKCWHYPDDHQEGVLLGETESVLAQNYLGVVSQSNWDYSLDRVRRKRRTWKTLWLKR
jgi:hypothetical protein